MEYRITLRNHLSAFNRLIIFTIFLVVGTWLVGENKGFERDLFVFLGTFYIVNLIPVLILHFQYYNANKDVAFCTELVNQHFIFKTQNFRKVIDFSEVQKVDIYMLFSMYRGSKFQLLPFEEYHYATIQTRDEKLIVTSLMVKNLVNEFKDLGIKMERHQCFYPYIK